MMRRLDDLGHLFGCESNGTWLHLIPRLLTGGIGHNPPQEAPQAFADPVAEARSAGPTAVSQSLDGAERYEEGPSILPEIPDREAGTTQVVRTLTVPHSIVTHASRAGL
jgi:hypothetical protein